MMSPGQGSEREQSRESEFRYLRHIDKLGPLLDETIVDALPAVSLGDEIVELLFLVELLGVLCRIKVSVKDLALQGTERKGLIACYRVVSLDHGWRNKIKVDLPISSFCRFSGMRGMWSILHSCPWT